MLRISSKPPRTSSPHLHLLPRPHHLRPRPRHRLRPKITLVRSPASERKSTHDRIPKRRLATKSRRQFKRTQRGGKLFYKNSKTWRSFLILNIGGLLGIGLSMFTLPGTTRVSIWATCSAVALVAMNFLLYFYRKRGKQENSRPERQSVNPAIVFVIFLYLLDVILSHFWK